MYEWSGRAVRDVFRRTRHGSGMRLAMLPALIVVLVGSAAELHWQTDQRSRQAYTTCAIAADTANMPTSVTTSTVWSDRPPIIANGSK